MNDYNDPLRVAKREIRELKKMLRDNATAVVRFIEGLDVELKKADSPQRTVRIAQALTSLETINDMALHFGLKVPLKNLRPRRRPGEMSPASGSPEAPNPYAIAWAKRNKNRNGKKNGT